MFISHTENHSYVFVVSWSVDGRFKVVQIPGLLEVTSSLTPQSHPGLLGICLSGAGPTILALATHNFEAIAEGARVIFAKRDIQVDWELLEVVGGSQCYPAEVN